MYVVLPLLQAGKRIINISTCPFNYESAVLEGLANFFPSVKGRLLTMTKDVTKILRSPHSRSRHGLY